MFVVYCLFNIFISFYIKAHVIVDDLEKTMKCESYTYMSTDLDKPFLTDDIDLEDFQSPIDINVVSCKPNNLNFCFALWSNDSNGITVKKKGCFSDDSNCVGKNVCINYEKKSNLHFCCCEGDLCNRDFFYEPLSLQSSATVEDETQIISSLSRTLVFFSSVAVIIAALVYVVFYPKCPCLRKNNQHAQVSRSPSPSIEKLRAIELIHLIVKGRFGDVWKAKYKNNFVAVKIIPVEYRNLWTAEKEIFKLPFMNHDNILQFIGAEKQEGGMQPGYWIITAYQELGSLYDYLKRNSVSWEELCTISFTMARGLAHLHEEIASQSQDYYKPSIAHRDFKSANVLLKNDLTACIADFGFALIFRSAVCTDNNEQIGTKRYMAPEILEGSVGFSNNSFLCMDMYSCGLVLWEILTRCTVHEEFEKKHKLPYEAELGEHPSIEELQELVVFKKMRPLLKDSWKNHDLLSHVCEIIEECWDHDSEARLSAACVMERFSWHLHVSSKSGMNLLQNI